jgi:anaerobic selenocysteine-containing dehydrogenase
MEVYVKNGRIVYAKGNPLAPDYWTRCGKGLASVQQVEDPDRLTYPMRRGGWVPGVRVDSSESPGTRPSN